MTIERPLAGDTDIRLQVGPLEIDLCARQVLMDDRLLELAAKEFDLLAYLAARPGQVFSRDQLLRAVWHSASEWQRPSTVTEHVRRIRAKTERDPRRPRLLKTVRGTGYRLDRTGDGPDDERATPSSRLRRLATGVLTELTDAVIITDLQLRVRNWNHAAEHLYGWTEQEALDRQVLEVLPWVQGNDKLAAAWESFGINGRWTGEVGQVTRDGSVICVLASTTLVRDESGEPVGIVSVNRVRPGPAKDLRSPGGRS